MDLIQQNLEDYPEVNTIARHLQSIAIESAPLEDFRNLLLSSEDLREHLNEPTAYEGRTPLHIAVVNYNNDPSPTNSDVVRFLLEIGANPTISDNDHNTAHDLAPELISGLMAEIIANEA